MKSKLVRFSSNYLWFYPRNIYPDNPGFHPKFPMGEVKSQGPKMINSNPIAGSTADRRHPARYRRRRHPQEQKRTLRERKDAEPQVASRQHFSSTSASRSEAGRAGLSCAVPESSGPLECPLELCAVLVVLQIGGGDGLPGDGDQLAARARAAVGALGKEGVLEVTDAFMFQCNVLNLEDW